VFIIGVCPIKKSNETCENGQEKNEKQFPCWGNSWGNFASYQ